MAIVKRSDLATRQTTPFFPNFSVQRLPRADLIRSDQLVREDENSAPSQIASQHARIAELEELVADLRSQLETGKKDAREEGRILGLAEAESNAQDLLAVFQNTLADATAAIAARIDGDRDIAVMIARAVLAEVFGDGADFAAMVSATAEKWASHLADDTVLGISVSAMDFADDAALLTLQSRKNITVRRDEKLKSGGCVFELQLGKIDASIPLQIGAADELLAQFEVDREAAE